jgi:hypothetical protein
MDCLDTTSPFLPLPDGLVITSLLATETQLVVQVGCRLPTACCPLCQLPSDRIHGHYGRTVADLPCAGRRVILSLSVRKFVCRTPTCPRQIFTERLPDLVQSYARNTNRLRDVLIALGLATSAEVCDRLAPKLGFACSAPSPALPPRRFAFWALMIGRGKKKMARSTEPCWSILSGGAQSRFFRTARKRPSKPGCLPTRKLRWSAAIGEENMPLQPAKALHKLSRSRTNFICCSTCVRSSKS